MANTLTPTVESVTTPITNTDSARPAADPWWQRALRNRALVVGSSLSLLVVVIATILPLVVPLDPYAVDPVHRLAKPGGQYLLGTDSIGRDVFARIVIGARTSLVVGTSVAIIAGALGTLIGLLASAFKILDHVLMRVCDGLIAIPAVLLAVALASALGPTIPNLVIALSIVYTPTVARLVRSRALGVMAQTFVEASRVQGARTSHIIVRHTLPNVLSVLAVQVTFIFADSIITEAALSFLGAGVPAPEPSWGNILYDGKSVILQAPVVVIAASLALVVTVLALNLFGDGLRDLVDPRTEHVAKRGIIVRLVGACRPTIRNPKETKR